MWVFLAKYFKKLCRRINSWGELIRKGEIYYKKKGNIPYTGVLRNYFPTGEISLINNFKDGKQHDNSFHRNGNLAMEGQFLDGKQHGFWSEYYDNGKLYWKLEYIEGLQLTVPSKCFTKMVKLNLRLFTVMENQRLTGCIMMNMEKKKEWIFMKMENFFLRKIFLKFYLNFVNNKS